MAAFGDDFPDDATASTPQLVQSVEPRYPRGEIDILALVSNRHAELLIGCEAGNLSP
jgi:hypothetical protein